MHHTPFKNISEETNLGKMVKGAIPILDPHSRADQDEPGVQKSEERQTAS